VRINQKIRSIRLSRGFTLEKLARLSNLSRGYLSKIERAEEPPPVSTLQTIAVALGVDISELFAAGPGDEHTVDSLDVVRRADRGEKYSSRVGYDYLPLVRQFRGKYMHPFLMIIAPGETKAFKHDSEEFCYVGRHHRVEAGDCFYFDSRRPHHYRNRTRGDAVLVAVNFNYRRF
jgi:transcriptional regulator with XRE-family HTH domain